MHHGAQIRVGRVHSEEVEREGPERILSGYDGLLVPGGFGERGIEGMVDAIRFARDRQMPFFGICLGMQCAVIEFARNVAQLAGVRERTAVEGWTSVQGDGGLIGLIPRGNSRLITENNDA